MGHETEFKYLDKKTRPKNLYLLLDFKGAQVWDFDRSDFHYFYTIKTFWVGDFGAKI